MSKSKKEIKKGALKFSTYRASLDEETQKRLDAFFSKLDERLYLQGPIGRNFVMTSKGPLFITLSTISPSTARSSYWIYPISAVSIPANLTFGYL